MKNARLFGALFPLTFSLFAAGAAIAAEEETPKLAASVEIPQLNVGGYHRPYVAVWVEDAEDKVVENAAVWYQLKGKRGKGAGTKWLPDLRQWWRTTGRDLQLPIDGVSGATRPAGKHELSIGDKDLKPGNYVLIVEAAREHGGRELVEVPFAWPATEAKTYAAAGTKELGEVSLTVRP